MNQNSRFLLYVGERSSLFSRKFFVPSLLATTVVVCGALAASFAQDESDTAAPSEALAEAKGIAAQLAASVESVRGQFQQAQKDGDPIKAVILEINPKNQRLSLSVRELIKQQERQEMVKYAHSTDSDDTVSLGDMLREKNSG